MTIQVRTGASLNRGKSRQDYGTPRDFLDAVEKRFGKLEWDLAAVAANSVCGSCYYGHDADEPDSRDSLTADWRALDGNLWLNPPFANIEPWAAKCAAHWDRVGFIFLLTPASIGTDWFARHCQARAYVLGISPRLTFVGTDDPYPKDLALSVYGHSMHGFDTWRWK